MMDDLISRQAAYNALMAEPLKWDDLSVWESARCHQWMMDVGVIEALPPAQSEPCEDVVSRNAIVQKLNKMDRYVSEELRLCDTDKKFPKNEVFIVDDVYEEIVEKLPSTQPEPSTDIQDVLRYLDDVLHPLISPNNWNVYSELHDMVSSLPSAQPEVLACGNGELDAQSEQRWIPCSERLPEEWRDVLLSFDKSITEWTNVGYMFRDEETFEYWFQSDGMSYKKDDVLAWMPLPDAYEEDD